MGKPGRKITITVTYNINSNSKAGWHKTPEGKTLHLKTCFSATKDHKGTYAANTFHRKRMRHK